MNSSQETLRLDKWLWCARFYKTRRLSTEAINGGHVRLNGHPAKPAKNVKVNDKIVLRKEIYSWTIRVLIIPTRRGPATEAATLYLEDEESRAARQEMAELRRMQPTIQMDRGSGRPTKRDRRAMNRIRGR
ncbi:MAG: RNA-binding S4 domain-containing protein [Magnetococcales bacterium]|nr:RNA-binding S4 domain-containing protein [Magnetococcales bacterium]